MATQTPNLNLKKPAGTDYVLVGDLNGNMDIVDTTVGKLSELETAAKNNLVAAINEANDSGASAPYIGENGNWYQWDSSTRQYVDSGVHAEGDAGVAAGFGTPTATAEGLPTGATPTVTIIASGTDIAKVFAFAFGIPKGEVGAAAGFGTPTATATLLDAGDNPTVTIQASGTDIAKVFDFNFGIPKGDQGNPGTAGNNWYVGTAITGTSQTPASYVTGIENAQIGDMYLNNGALPNTGRTYRCTVGGNAATAKWAYACLLRGADGTGTGDMLKSTYDSDSDGIVDDSEKLGGNLPAYFAAAEDVVPKTRKINNKALSADISLIASDVGAVPTNRTVNDKALSNDIDLTASDVGAVPTTRKINNKALSADISLSASDVGAAPSSAGVPTGGSNGDVLTLNDGIPEWSEPSGAVQSVNSKTGVVVLNSADVGAAAVSHSHGNISTDGKIGTTANLPLFTGAAGAIGTKNVEDAKTALNITPHKYLYAGRDLSTIFTAAQLHSAVAAGDFSNIRVGDYWAVTLNGTYYDYAESANKTLSNAVVIYEVAGINTALQYGDTPVPNHLVMISRDCLPNTMKMRSADTTWYNTTATNPWLGSAAYETFNNATNGIIKLMEATALGAYIYAGANAKGMRFLGETKASGAAAATSWAWLDRGKLWLPTEREVWGQDVWSEHNWGGGIPFQYPLFQGGLRHIIKGLGNGGSRYYWWCSSSCSGSAAAFCIVSNPGIADASGASNALGVPLCFLFS